MARPVVPGSPDGADSKVPLRAVCMNLLIAAQAMGFGANWITDWYAYDPDVDALLGLAPGERVSGYVHLGTASEAPQERVRPDIAAITSRWTAA